MGMLHYRAREAPRPLVADDLVRIGVLCDKYDFTEALRLWSSSELRAEILRADTDDLYKLLEAAYLLDTWEEYDQVSTQIILRQLGPFEHSPRNTSGEKHVVHGSQQALEKSIGYLEAKRQDAIFAVIFAVEKAVSALFLIDSKDSGHPGRAWLGRLEGVGLWPIRRATQRHTSREIFDWMRSFTDPWDELGAGNSHLGGDFTLRMQEKLREIQGSTFNANLAVCLDCVKTDGESGQSSKCRVGSHGRGTGG